MNAWQPRRREYLVALLLLASCLSTQTGFAAELVWIGGAGDSWYAPENWAPVDGPGGEPVQRIPQDGDTVLIADPTHGSFVRFYEDELPRLTRIEIANGLELTASGRLENVRIELASAALGGNLHLLGSSEIELTGDGGAVLSERLFEQSPGPGFRMEGGSIRAAEGARLTFSDLGNQDGWHELRDVSLLFESGTTLALSAWNRVQLVDADILFAEQPTTIYMPLLSHLTINANTFGTNASPSRFDGDIHMEGSTLTVIVPGGWTLGGRLELLNDRPTNISGSAITVDSIGPNDGIFVGIGDFRDATIDAELILMENAQISFGDDAILNLDGNVTNFRSELGAGNGLFRFAGDVTTFAVPTTLMVSSYLDRGMFVLDADITIDDAPDAEGTPRTLRINPDARFTGEGTIFVDGILQLRGGAIVDVPIVNRGAVEFASPADQQRTVRRFLQTDDATLTIRSSSFGPMPLLYASNGAELGGKLQIETFGADVGHIELLAAGGDGITGRFSDYDLDAPEDGFWKITYGPTSVTLDVVDVLHGDYNGNGLVEQADLDFVLSHWGAPAATAPEGWVIDPPSGTIDQDELDRVLSGWGAQAILPQAPAATAPVPEPASAWLAVLAAAAAANWFAVNRRRVPGLPRPGIPVMRRILRLTSIITASWLLVFTVPPDLAAAELVWIGGAGSSWHTPENWAPIDGPGGEPIQRIPEEGDTVLIADTTHGSVVSLDGETARLGALEIANGFQLTSGGHFVYVEDNGTANTIVRGLGSTLTLSPTLDQSRSFQTDFLEVRDGAVFLLQDDRFVDEDEDATAYILHGAVIDATSQITGFGTPVFGNEATPSDTLVLNNEGTIRPLRGPIPDRPGMLQFITQGGAVLDYDGENDGGIIDADEPGRAIISGWRAQSVPFGGALLIGADDAIDSFQEMHNVRMEFNGSDEQAAYFSGINVNSMRISGASSIDINSGVAVISGPLPPYPVRPPDEFEFEFVGGSVHVHENATLRFSATDGPRYRLMGSSFHLDDESSLTVTDGSVTLSFDEVDLDGESGKVTIELLGSLTVNAPAIDNDASSPGFDGDFFVSGGSAIARLTVNVPGGWVLSGRLVAGDGANVHGTSITVDSCGPDDGLIGGGGDLNYATIHSDLIFSENARVDVDFGRLYLEGNVTNYRSVLGTGEFYGLNFRGDVTTFAVPTMLNVAASFQGGTVVLDANLMVPSGIGVFFDEDVQIVGDGRVLYEERGDFVRGDYNGNGLVEQADLDLVLSHWGEIAATAPDGWVIDPPSGTIDQDELDRVLSGWGASAVLRRENASAVPVPEPVSGILALWALGAGLISVRGGHGIGSPKGTAFL